MDIEQIKKQGISKGLVGELQRCQNEIVRAASAVEPRFTEWNLGDERNNLDRIVKIVAEAKLLLAELEANNRPR